MSYVLNELISMGKVKSVEEESQVAEKIAEDSIRIRDALSRIEKSKTKWESEYSVFDSGSREGIATESKETKVRNSK